MMHRCGMLGAVSLLIAGCSVSGRGLSPIRLEPITTLGATSGDGAIATTPVVSARHPGGFRIVVPASSAIGALPLAFSDDGTFLGALHGDSTLYGSFGGPMFARFGPGDSIWVFDNDSRVLIFSPARQYVRTTVLPTAAIDAIILPDDRILMSPPSGSDAQLLAADGRVLRTFGERDSTEARVSTSSRIASGANGTFWTASHGRLQHWDTAGTRIGGLQLRPEWLINDSSLTIDRTHRWDRPPPPRIIGAWIDEKGRLWVVGAGADRNWQSGLGVRDPAHMDSEPTIERDKYFDTIIDVRDATTGRLIATTQVDNYYSSMAEPGVLVHEVRTSAGWHRAELMRVTLDETSRP